MPSGHPDWQTLAGSAIGGSKVSAYTFIGDISSETIGYFDLAEISSGEQHSFTKIHIGCEYDDAVHDIALSRVSDGWAFFVGKFIGHAEFDLVTDPQGAGNQIRVAITNNSASTRTFEGSVSWVIREL